MLHVSMGDAELLAIIVAGASDSPCSRAGRCTLARDRREAIKTDDVRRGAVRAARGQDRGLDALTQEPEIEHTGGQWKRLQRRARLVAEVGIVQRE